MLLTIGHSNRTAEEFTEMLSAHEVKLLIDVRAFPKSRYNPHFNSGALAEILTAAGIEYRHMPELGGMRKAKRDSTNTAWRNDTFRGYADYMQKPEFEAALSGLMQRAMESRAAIMCAEANPRNCHRSLIADALTARGFEVEHILSLTVREPHKMTGFAKVEGSRVTYPGENLELFGG
jgi:uncharacterized protein (DUF488 family)